MQPTVINGLRTFLPAYLKQNKVLSPPVKRAIWAIENCRTPALGGHAYHCKDCNKWEYGAHSCNHRSCPLCGKQATAEWVDRELGKRVAAPYFMVTFTLPSELRCLFLSKHAKAAYSLFFEASSKALRDKLADQKGFKAAKSGFIGILHTWNQQLLFHPHIHYIVPGAGLDKNGKVITVPKSNYLLKLDKLIGAFRQYFREGSERLELQVAPSVWKHQWGINIQPFGDGKNIIKYLGAYVCRTAISDSRIRSIDTKNQTITFSYKDRTDKHKVTNRLSTITGVEFTTRYLRHVLPQGLRAIRYYGYCHPAGKKTRQKIAFHTGIHLDQATAETTPEPIDDAESKTPKCKSCGNPMIKIGSFPPQITAPKLAAALAVSAASNHPPPI